MNPHAWRDLLEPWELQALEQTEVALLVAPKPRTGVLAWGEAKVGQLAERVPEGVKGQVTQAMSSALERMQAGSSWLVNRESVYDKIRRQVGPVRGSLDILRLPVHELDVMAHDFARNATSGLTLEGAVAGASGIIGLAADIPILYCILFKTIQEIALCYGFTVKPPQERFHMLQVLDLGHNLGNRHRSQIAMQIFRMQAMIGSGTSVEALEAVAFMGSSGVGTQTQALARNLRLARQLALDLLERKLLQSLLIVGTAVGAASNYQLARDVGIAAFHLYRRRFLMEVALRRSA